MPAPTGSTDDHSMMMVAAPDTTAPTILSVSPASGATDVLMASTIVVQFSEDVQAQAGAIAVSTGSTPVMGTVSSGADLVTFTPSTAFAAATYSVTLTTAVKDLAGNPLAMGRSWSFTVPVRPPELLSSYPKEGAKDVLPGTTIRATFDKPIVATSANGTKLMKGASELTGAVAVSGDTITFSPSAPLSLAGNFSLVFPVGLQNTDGGVTTAASSVSFSTQAARIAFLSSTVTSGAIATSGAPTGLQSADKICQDLANAVPALSGRQFVAWLSTTSVDAICHAAGFASTRANTCGQTALPLPGPWIWPDGRPAFTVHTQFNYALEYALADVSETGAHIAADEIWLGSGSDGAYSAPACTDWTSTSGNATYTTTTDTQVDDIGQNGCSAGGRILCVEKGTGGAPLAVPLVSKDGPQKRIFATSVQGTGKLSTWPGATGFTGRPAGDKVCQSLAASAALPNAASFKSWLSVTGGNAIDHITSNGPWVSTQGITVANNKADLTGTLRGPIFTQTGAQPPIFAWTGSNGNGTASADNCNGWDDNTAGFQADFARLEYLDQWSDAGAPVNCNATNVLYCIED